MRAAALIWPALCSGQEPLTLDEVLRLARERGPALALAKERLKEAKAELEAEGRLLGRNPELEAALGRRASSRGGTLEAEVGLVQPLEMAGQRGARRAAAEAALRRAATAGADERRRFLGEVACAFFRAVFAEQQLRLARLTEGVAQETFRIAEHRLEGGDIPRLDVNLSAAALSRARAEVKAAEGHLHEAMGELRALLGVAPGELAAVRGELAPRRSYELQGLLASAEVRADLQETAAEGEEAAGDLRVARAAKWPDVGLGARFAREEEASVVLGTLSLSLPFFERGRKEEASAEGRSRRAAIELEAGRRRVRLEVDSALEVYRRRLEAVDELEQGALLLLDANETLARKSYEAGQLGLADLLVVRRETMETRREHLRLSLEAALAMVAVETSAGVLQ